MLVITGYFLPYLSVVEKGKAGIIMLMYEYWILKEGRKYVEMH